MATSGLILPKTPEEMCETCGQSKPTFELPGPTVFKLKGKKFLFGSFLKDTSKGHPAVPLPEKWSCCIQELSPSHSQMVMAGRMSGSLLHHVSFVSGDAPIIAVGGGGFGFYLEATVMQEWMNECICGTPTRLLFLPFFFFICKCTQFVCPHKL